jgi:hypothetical protein
LARPPGIHTQLYSAPATYSLSSGNQRMACSYLFRHPRVRRVYTGRTRILGRLSTTTASIRYGPASEQNQGPLCYTEGSRLQATIDESPPPSPASSHSSSDTILLDDVTQVLPW